MKKNVFNLKSFTDQYKPKLLFLSEPQLFQSDLPSITRYFKGEYTTVLNSEDLHNPDLMLTTCRAKGGTIVMWQKELDPYVTAHVPESSSFLPVVIDIPGWKTMIHLATYLPTAGKETEYLEDLARMRISIEELLSKFPSAALFVRGDCNSSKTNPKRNAIFSQFCSDLNLLRVDLQHNTYHHFLGQGTSDSELDVLLFSNQHDVHEELVAIHCSQLDHLVDSHHDLLLSVTTVPSQPESVQPPDKSRNLVAPRLLNTRHKILWTEETIHEYESLVSHHLPRIRKEWLNPASETSMSILIECTNMILSQAALMLNKSIQLSNPSSPKSAKIPAVIQRSNRRLLQTARKLRMQSQNPIFSHSVLERTRTKYKSQKAHHQRLVRRRRMLESNKHDAMTFSVYTSESPTLYQAIRAARRTADVPVKKLTVGDKLYEGDEVCDGFYDSISYLKTRAHTGLESSQFFQSANEDYENILKICKEGQKIPKMSLEKAREILHSIRPAVIDHSSITGNHFRYAGEAGLKHFQELLNALIDDLNNMSTDALNTTWACILHKGHGKDKTSAESYRTISTCPFLSKGLDAYIADIYGHIWDLQQAETQYQGKGSSHELAALLLTETIQYSLNSSKSQSLCYI